MLNELYKKLDSRFNDMVEIRRYLHMNPEPSFKETKTAKYIADFYRDLGVEVRTNVGGNGVVATVRGGKPGKTVALRADFDALPIHDEKDCEYKSTVEGVMHACGHDGHTATLLTLGKTLHELKDELPGTYVLIHQHAEEYQPGGAISMIEDGCLDGVDVIFGTHLWSTKPFRQIEYRVGPIMAAADRFEIKVKGRGGHGAMPHETKDAVAIGAQLVTALQQIVSRRVDPLEPAVLSIGTFKAENSFNIIADEAQLHGTVRTFSEETRTLIEQEMGRIIRGTAEAANCEIEFDFVRGYPTVDNHENETMYLKETAEQVPGVDAVAESAPQMGGEDFAYYMQHVPGSFFFTGAMLEDEKRVYPHHHPRFDFDERAMVLAAKTLGAAAIGVHDK
ncbi:M20 family metallopeptidase [Planococcus lenghuensis]|uniref:Peptidase M20 n=1 Tax=Planococcus lenghuensis TaxID=2213202 RepID=A0A1Q2KY27_9BACL|nr:M20 family metallopeptidase [Planococcus lenghuensis]AQQ52562.1 peptidase M20 [Planococcus lenghuensis]